MKAKFVFESINFERGGDPKHSMDIGRNRKENDIRLVLACTEPRENRPKDDIKRIKYAIENFFNYDEIISIRIDYLKDINLFRNVTIFEAFIKGAPSNTNVINLIDHIYRYSTSDGKTFGECYQIGSVDDPVNKNNTLFWFKITEGEDKGCKIMVKKFDDPFGKYWGIEWDLSLGDE